MTYAQLHEHNYNLGDLLTEHFKEQLLSISQNVLLCYHPHYKKFTVSVYEGGVDFNYDASAFTEIETEHLILSTSYTISTKIKQLAHDITKFIMNEEVQCDHFINGAT